MNPVSEFIARVKAIYNTGSATELSYRSAFEFLIHALDDDVTALDEPKRVECGAPDFLVPRGEIAIGHIEAKDIGVGLRAMKGANKDQQNRYLKALPNLIYTNCLDWDFYRDGALLASVTIGQSSMGEILPTHEEEFDGLENLLRDFIVQTPRTITSSQALAKMMAGKAGLIKDVLSKALKEDSGKQTDLAGQYKAFQDHLIHDITPEDFADIYAETIAYGLFSARLHDPSLDGFSRTEALDLLPKSNPFLRSLFGYVAGPDLDERARWIIDDLARVYLACDVSALMKDFGKLTQRNDPFLHFYEDFLKEYNPDKRKARGVWYTPEPVVNFIVRAVDEVLQTEFGLPLGLADNSKITVDWDTGMNGNKGKAITIKKDVHRVQILDPASGTGTFLAEVIKQIAPRIQDIAPGQWNRYVEDELLPRLHGFELLMASYAMCHMKLDMILTEMGYTPTATAPRLGVYLTNSLEEGDRDVRDLFMAQWLTREAQEASSVKRQIPIMCVIGNPPYLGESTYKGDWIMRLMDAYKKEPGGIEKLKERNPKWINDDYVKFIRFAEHMIDKNGEGVLGFITNHGYLDNPTFRGMRWHLLKTFDKLYVLNLHGNAKKKEVTPEGKPDKNVFDIQQGVSIIIGVKKRGNSIKGTTLAEVSHADLWGDRALKYESLWDNGLTGDIWQRLEHHAPQYPLIRRDYELEAAYKVGFGVQEFMPVNSVGIVTARDALAIDMDKQALWERVQDFARLDPEAAREKYALGKDVRDWTVAWAQEDVRANLAAERCVPILYRPFDMRWTYYTGKSRGFLCYPRNDVMRHMFEDNLALGLTRTIEGGRNFADALVFNRPITHHSLSIKEVNSLSPIYIYPTEQQLGQTRRINFNPELWQKLHRSAKHPTHGTPNEVQTFDYIYGVLHCPAYRDTYAEFLKIDFPCIPWPKKPDEFWDVSAKGGVLRKLHLMEPQVIDSTPYAFEGEGDMVVGRVQYEGGRVWINATQSFADVPEVSWGFYIGGYQPAQKWLKDRKGRALSFDDIRHYQRIVKILAETDRVMRTITMDLEA